jgi:hypothetical protein
MVIWPFSVYGMIFVPPLVALILTLLLDISGKAKLTIWIVCILLMAPGVALRVERRAIKKERFLIDLGIPPVRVSLVGRAYHGPGTEDGGPRGSFDLTLLVENERHRDITAFSGELIFLDPGQYPHGRERFSVPLTCGALSRKQYVTLHRSIPYEEENIHHKWLKDTPDCGAESRLRQIVWADGTEESFGER